MSTNNMRVLDILDRSPIQGVDFADSLNRFSQNAEVYLRVLKAFTANAPELLERLAGVTEQTVSDYQVGIHGLKGSLYSVGATGLGDAARELEAAAKVSDWETIEQNNPLIIEGVLELISQFEDLVEQVDGHEDQAVTAAPTHQGPSDTGSSKELMTRLLEATDNVDIETIESLVEDLDRADYFVEPSLIDFLKRNLLLYRYGEIKEKLLELVA